MVTGHGKTKITDVWENSVTRNYAGRSWGGNRGGFDQDTLHMCMKLSKNKLKYIQKTNIGTFIDTTILNLVHKIRLIKHLY